MKITPLLISVIVALVISGCAFTHTSSYLEGKPVLIYLTDTKTSPRLQEESARAFLAALNRYNWEIRNYNTTDKIIIAEACRQTMHCAEIQATVMGDGSVSIVRTPGQVLTIHEGTILRQWVNSLQRQYQKNMRTVR
jgi:hypothetical protein